MQAHTIQTQIFKIDIFNIKRDVSCQDASERKKSLHVTCQT